MATDEQIQFIVKKLNGMLWLTDASEEEVERLAALLKANEPTDWLNIAVIDHLTDFARDEVGGIENSGYVELGPRAKNGN
jgi:hypothetical protein